MSWTEQRVETLKDLWAEGLSASQIAGQLGGVTRNAVIGKVHRLGLPKRGTASRIYSKPKKSKPEKRARLAGGIFNPHTQPPKEVLLPALKKETIPENIISFQDLKEGQCKFPYGSPKHEPFGYCGKPVSLGKTYCAGCEAKTRVRRRQ